MTATDSDLYYDPYDFEIDTNPYPVWKRLRDEAPVYWNDRHGFYALSRYDDVLNGLLDTDTFRSGHGIVLEMITDEPYENIPMMIMKDPPAHTRLRKLISAGFTPRMISRLDDRIEMWSRRIVDDVLEGHRADKLHPAVGVELAAESLQDDRVAHDHRC